MRSTGASKLRSITTASREALSSVIVFVRLSLRAELHEVAVDPVEPGLPDGPVLLGPGRDLLQRRGVEGPWQVTSTGGRVSGRSRTPPASLPGPRCPRRRQIRAAGGTQGHLRSTRSTNTSGPAALPRAPCSPSLRPDAVLRVRRRQHVS